MVVKNKKTLRDIANCFVNDIKDGLLKDALDHGLQVGSYEITLRHKREGINPLVTVLKPSTQYILRKLKRMYRVRKAYLQFKANGDIVVRLIPHQGV